MFWKSGHILAVSAAEQFTSRSLGGTDQCSRILLTSQASTVA